MSSLRNQRKNPWTHPSNERRFFDEISGEIKTAKVGSAAFREGASDGDEGTHIFEKIAAMVKGHLKSLGSGISKSDETHTHAMELDSSIEEAEENVVNDVTFAPDEEDDDSEEFDEPESASETEFESLNTQP